MPQDVTVSSGIRQSRGTLETFAEPIIIKVNPRIGDIVESYLEHRNDDVDIILKALDRGDFDRISHLAHDLVGTGGSFGFEKMSLIGRSLESAAAANQADEIKQLVVE